MGTRLSIRRFWLAVVASLLGAVVAAPSSLAAGPEHTKLESFVLTFAAGQACAFPTSWDVTAHNNNQLVFPARANGDVITRQTGTNIVTVTNLDSGASVDLRGGFGLDFIAHADGTFTIVGRGAIIGALFPTDFGGPGMWWFRGHIQDTADTGFNTLTHEVVGNVTDLCTLLAD